MTTAPANGNGYGRYTFYAIAAGVVFTMVGSVVWVGGIANEVAQNKAMLQAQDERLKELSADLRINDLDTSNIKVAMQEIETQFCASDIVRNLMHATELRNTSLLWEREFKTAYPTDNAFYPQICNRTVTK